MEHPVVAVHARVFMNPPASRYLKLILLKIFKCLDPTTIISKMNMNEREVAIFLNTPPRNREWKDHILYCRKIQIPISSQSS